MEFEYYLTVRGYELDSFGHVNNSVYLNYIEQASGKMLPKVRAHFCSFKKGKLFLPLFEINIRYIPEAKLFDELVISQGLCLSRLMCCSIIICIMLRRDSSPVRPWLSTCT